MVLSDTELQQLACFMAEPCRSPRFENNYQYATELWNMNNEKSCLANGDIPDYANTTPCNEQLKRQIQI